MSSSPNGTDPLAGGSEVSLGEIYRSLRRRWRLLAGVFVGTVAVVMAATFVIPPVYESEGILRVRSQESPASGMLDDILPVGNLSLPGLGNADVETEIGILLSRRIADAVVDSLGLHVDLVRPMREARTEVLGVLRAGEGAARGVYTLRREADGTYAASVRRNRQPVQLPSAIAIGEPFEVGNMQLVLDPRLRDDPPSLIRFQVRPFRRVATKFRERLDVARSDSRSQLIEISYRHRDPWLAEAVVNHVIDEFLDYSTSAEKHESRREADILREQVASLANDLREAEESLQSFQERERIIEPEEQAVQHVRRIAEVQAGYDALLVERSALGTLLADIDATPADVPSQPAYRRLAGFPSFISNGAVQDVLQALTELENDRAELLGRRTEQNEDVRVLDRRIDELRDQLFRVGANYLSGLDHQIASASAALAAFGSELESIPAVEVEYARRLRERELLSEVYLLMQARLRQTEVQEAIDDSRVRVIDYGVLADRPAFPRPLISLVLATVLGLMAGIFTVVGVETMNPSVRSRRDAERAAPGVPVLGIIPHTGARPSTARRPIRVGPLRLRGTPLAAPSCPITQADPWHPASEAFRGLATTLFRNSPNTPRVLVVTSASPAEGKSTVAANLAVSLARNGTRTLLIDGDLRTGTLASIFRSHTDAGWPDVVLARSDLGRPLENIRIGEAGATLDLLPAGSPSVHPAELLSSQRLRDLLDRLRAEYEAIIIDSPPLEHAYDAALLGGLADATLLVVRTGANGREAIEEATLALQRANATIAGVVLNDLEAPVRAPTYPASGNGRPHQDSTRQNRQPEATP